MDVRVKSNAVSAKSTAKRAGPNIRVDPKSLPSPKVGRPRSEKTRKAITAAVLSLLKGKSYADISIEQIATKARVSKHSIYRWWHSKGELVLDAFLDYALERAPKIRPSNDTFADIEEFVVAAHKTWRDPLYEKGLRGLSVEMAFDPALRQKFYAAYLAPRRTLIGTIVEHGIERGQVRPDTDIETVVDIMFGFVWFHVSFDPTGVDERRAARNLIALLRPSVERKR